MSDFEDDRHPRDSAGRFAAIGSAVHALFAGRKHGAALGKALREKSEGLGEKLREGAERLKERVEEAGEKANEAAEQAIEGDPFAAGKAAVKGAVVGGVVGLALGRMAGRAAAKRLLGERQKAHEGREAERERHGGEGFEPEDEDVDA